MANIYRQHAHNRSIGWSTWHIQWCTKYRYKIFAVKEYKETCLVLLYEAAKKHDFLIFDCEIDVDHVHVVASLPLTMKPTDVVNKLKGFSAKGMFQLFPQLRTYYRKGHLWSPGKFVGSVGHITLEKAKEYLKTHHAKKPLTGIPAFFVKQKKLPEGQSFRAGRMSISIYTILIIVRVH